MPQKPPRYFHHSKTHGCPHNVLNFILAHVVKRSQSPTHVMKRGIASNKTKTEYGPVGKVGGSQEPVMVPILMLAVNDEKFGVFDQESTSIATYSNQLNLFSTVKIFINSL